MRYLSLNQHKYVSYLHKYKPPRVAFGAALIESYEYRVLTNEQKFLLITLLALTTRFDNNIPLDAVIIENFGNWTDLNSDINVLVLAGFYTVKNDVTKNQLISDKPLVNCSTTNIERLLPSWLNLDAWNEFLIHRKAINKPVSQMAMTKLLNVLEANQDDQVAIIDNTIQNRWTGLFALKGGTKDDVWESTYDNAFRQDE